MSCVTCLALTYLLHLVCLTGEDFESPSDFFPPCKATLRLPCLAKAIWPRKSQVLIVCHTLRFRLHGTQTFHICHCRGHFPVNIFPTEEVGASKPTRTLRCKRLRVLCLHYFLDKDFVQLDPATAAQLILAAERLRSWAPLRYSIFTIYFHFQSNSNFPAELFDSINLRFLLLTTTLVHISYLCVCPQTGQVHLFLWYT